MLEMQAKERTIHHFFHLYHSLCSEAKAAEIRADWKSQLLSVTNVGALKQELTTIMKENMDTLMNIARSLWSVVAVNLSLVLSLLGALAGLIFDFGTDIINLVIEIIVFLTLTYYLLSASRERWLPMEWASNLSHLVSVSDTSSTNATTSSLQTRPITTTTNLQNRPTTQISPHEVTGAIEQAISLV
ncbi:unnamed protein product, partial [Strongylus vulgaris]